MGPEAWSTCCPRPLASVPGLKKKTWPAKLKASELSVRNDYLLKNPPPPKKKKKNNNKTKRPKTKQKR